MNNIANWIIPSEAFNWIYENIKPKSVILELGSGFGSIALSLNYKITSIEQDTNWINLSNRVNYIYAPVVNGFYDRNVLKQQIPHKYDLLIIDGPTKASGGRLGFLDNIDLFYTRCPILIDDIHRDDEILLYKTISNRLKRKPKIYDSENKKFAVI